MKSFSAHEKKTRGLKRTSLDSHPVNTWRSKGIKRIDWTVYTQLIQVVFISIQETRGLRRRDLGIHTQLIHEIFTSTRNKGN